MNISAHNSGTWTLLRGIVQAITIMMIAMEAIGVATAEPPTPQPSTPPAIAAPSVADIASTDLEDAVTGYRWSWLAGGPFEANEITFHKDGTGDSHRFMFTWKVTGPRTAVLTTKGITFRMTFNEELTAYEAVNERNSRNRTSGLRESAVVQSPIHPPAVPGSPTATPIPPTSSASTASLNTPVVSPGSVPGNPPDRPGAASSWLANFETQLPNATAWAIAPLKFKAPVDLHVQFLALKTGLHLEDARNVPAWHPVYERASALCDFLDGSWKEREDALTHFAAGKNATLFVNRNWQARVEAIRTMLYGQTEQFRSARTVLASLKPVSAFTESTVAANFPPLSPEFAASDVPKPLSKEELTFFCRGAGPNGTNFGGGAAHLKLGGTIVTNSPVPIAVSATCYWIAESGRGHNSAIPLVPVNPPNGSNTANSSCDAEHRFSFGFEDVKSFGRNHGARYGISSSAGEYRGWIISVHDSSGKQITSASNMPGLIHLVQ